MEFAEASGARRAFFEAPTELSPRRRLAQDVGRSMRQIIEQLVDTRAPDEDLAQIAEQLDQIGARLAQFDHGRRYEGYGEASTAGTSDDGPPSGHTDFSPVVGTANPLAPPVVLSVDDDRQVLVGEVTFGSAYEGPPGHVHGGWVAAAFDEVLGAVQALSGQPGMTGRLTVDYRAPTPLHQPLRFEATLDEVQGRKIFTSCRLFAGDRLCAESTGLFISVDFAKLAQMMVDRERRDDD